MANRRLKRKTRVFLIPNRSHCGNMTSCDAVTRTPQGEQLKLRSFRKNINTTNILILLNGLTVLLGFSNSYDDRYVDIDIVSGRDFGHHADDKNHTRYSKRQDGAVDIDRDSAVLGSVGVNGVRDGLTKSFERAVKPSSTCGRLDVSVECTQDPVEGKLAEVAGGEY